jgi:mycofactocin glycosyltransferase
LAPALRLAHALRGVPGRWRETVRQAGRGLVATAVQLASAVTRVWWPPAAAAALFSPRLRRLLLLALVAPAVPAWMRRRGRIDLPRYIALRTADDAAYGFGVWVGVLQRRRIGPLLPRLRGQRPPTNPSRSANDRGPITVNDADALVAPT